MEDPTSYLSAVASRLCLGDLLTAPLSPPLLRTTTLAEHKTVAVGLQALQNAPVLAIINDDDYQHEPTSTFCRFLDHTDFLRAFLQLLPPRLTSRKDVEACGVTSMVLLRHAMVSFVGQSLVEIPSSNLHTSLYSSTTNFDLATVITYGLFREPPGTIRRLVLFDQLDTEKEEKEKDSAAGYPRTTTPHTHQPQIPHLNSHQVVMHAGHVITQAHLLAYLVAQGGSQAATIPTIRDLLILQHKRRGDHVHEYSPHSYNLQQLLTTDADEPAVCAFAAMSSAGRSEVGLPNNAI
jgi:hypothetical protein